jgi:signal transduction histidine kinase
MPIQSPANLKLLIRSLARPPVKEKYFWLLIIGLLIVAAIHLLVDDYYGLENSAFPTGIPVAILVLPISYAAIRYGLVGAVGTSAFATLLWLPDLLLPDGRGHPGNDIIELAIVDLVAIIFGFHINLEREYYKKVEHATKELLLAEGRYHQLFENNLVPILVFDANDRIIDLNPSAVSLFGNNIYDEKIADAFLKIASNPISLQENLLILGDGREFRINKVVNPASQSKEFKNNIGGQIMLEDITKERDVERRVSHYASMLIRLEEKQRTFLARELHDEPLQMFINFARRVESIEAELAGSLPKASKQLESLRHQALNASNYLRTLIKDLRPPALDQLGLYAALSSIVEETENSTDIQIDLNTFGKPTVISDECALTIFRVAQEAIRNAVKHSGASQISIILKCTSDDISFCVMDNGCGFDMKLVEKNSISHFGLLGMQERVRLVGGNLTVTSKISKGTTVSLSIPFKNAQEQVVTGLSIKE